jgi:hypothetical protein
MAHAAVDIDFSGSTDFADNFRQTMTGTTTGTSTQNVGGYVSTNATTGLTDNDIRLFDATAADGATTKSIFSGPATISFSIRTSVAASSFGIFIVNPASESSGVHFLSLFNWDATGANDRIRIFSGNTITTTTVGATAYDSGSTSTVNSGADAGGAFSTLTLTYSQGANNSAVLNLSIGTMSSGNVTLASGSYLSNYEIGFRPYDSSTAGNTSTDFDNFHVSADPVPEPSSLSLCGLATAGFLLRRRRARRC